VTTSNGDRPDQVTPDPSATAEEILCELFAQVLGIDRVGVEDNFFDLGGHSLLAAVLLARLADRFGVELPLKRFISNPSVRAVNEYLQDNNGHATSDDGAHHSVRVSQVASLIRPVHTPFLYESPFIRRAPRDAPRVRLFCFPHAGAGASFFAGWPHQLPPDIETIAIQLPGREDRIYEQPFTRVTALVHALTQVMRPYLDIPFAFFGHSAGSALAFELARSLRQRLSAEPAHLFLAGQSAPTAQRPELLYTLPEEEFTRRISELGGMNTKLLAYGRAAELFKSIVRADVELWEPHEFTESEPLSAAITIFGGTDDPLARPEDLAAWRDQTTGPFALHMFTGGHFFVRTDQAELIRLIAAALLAE
jgi:medium-chain acyl-[acyl-carrier-protein] hydrolase